MDESREAGSILDICPGSKACQNKNRCHNYQQLFGSPEEILHFGEDIVKAPE
jgi:hypothetical protein